MGYVAIPTFRTRQKITAAQWNQYLKGNIESLMARPQGVVSVTAADITTTSVAPTFVDMDSTNLKVTLTPSRANSIILCWLTGTFTNSASNSLNFRLAYGSGPTYTNQHAHSMTSGLGYMFTMIWYVTGLSAVSTVFKPQWCLGGAGTGSFKGTTNSYFGQFAVL